MNEEELKEERDLRATLDMWENMEEEQRLKQLKFLINEGFQKGKLEERERISFQVKRLMVDIEKHWDNVPNPKKSVLYGLKQLQKEIEGKGE